MNPGNEMLEWAKALWKLPRSLTGYGTVETLNYLKVINPDLRIKARTTGEVVFDWTIPDEWNIYDAYLLHEDGEKFADFKVNNLHVVGYSEPINERLNLDDFETRIHTDDMHNERIPYVTSYYSPTWGFCMSENQKKKMPDGEYLVYINAEKKRGKMHYADLVIKGKSKKKYSSPLMFAIRLWRITNYLAQSLHRLWLNTSDKTSPTLNIRIDLSLLQKRLVHWPIWMKILGI